MYEKKTQILFLIIFNNAIYHQLLLFLIYILYVYYLSLVILNRVHIDLYIYIFFFVKLLNIFRYNVIYFITLKS